MMIISTSLLLKNLHCSNKRKLMLGVLKGYEDFAIYSNSPLIIRP